MDGGKEQAEVVVELCLGRLIDFKNTAPLPSNATPFRSEAVRLAVNED